MKFRFLLLSVIFLIEGTLAGAACKRPTITAPTATPDSTGQQETITWTTDVAADSLVGYGSVNAGTLTPITDLSGVTNHSVTITGLIPTARYNWVIRSRAIDGGEPCDDRYYAYYNGPGGTSFTTAAPPDGSFDYAILPIGGHHVTQGYGMYYGIILYTLSGTYPGPHSLTLQLTGLPSYTTIRWTDNQVIGDDPDKLATTTIPNDTVSLYDFGPGPRVGGKEPYILTNVGGTTPPGNYTITMTMSGSGLPTHSATWALTVDPASAPFSGVAFPSGTPSSYPAIPNLATYMATASAYGADFCAQDTGVVRTIRPNDTLRLTPVSPGTTYDSWFYDGVLVYWNVQDLLSNGSDWAQCRTDVKQVYRDGYVARAAGAIPGYMMFTEGYYIDYLNTGEDADVTLINRLDSHMLSPYHANFVDVSYLQRETAYALKNAIYADKLGQNNPRLHQTTAFWRDYMLDHVLGHVDQICLSQNAQYFESFMVGLQAEALAQYYDLVNADPRIPPAIKCLADYMYSDVYNTVTSDPGAFPYDKLRMLTNAGPANGGSSMVDLNLLIVPMYAWVFKNTGLTQYQTEGDEIWSHGVLMDGSQHGLRATLGAPSGPPPGNSGKVFSQQYYWGTSYVAWRSSPETAKPSRLNQPESPSGLSVTVHKSVR
jgi:hypothetical protein